MSQDALREALEPCRACGSPCRVERFEGGPIEGVMTIYMCANSTKFGGDCPDPHAYLNVNAWNAREALSAPVVVGEREDLRELQDILISAERESDAGRPVLAAVQIKRASACLAKRNADTE